LRRGVDTSCQHAVSVADDCNANPSPHLPYPSHSRGSDLSPFEGGALGMSAHGQGKNSASVQLQCRWCL